jgi:hypothetical protein
VSVMKPSEESCRALHDCIGQILVWVLALKFHRESAQSFTPLNDLRTNLQVVSLDEPRIVGHGHLNIM